MLPTGTSQGEHDADPSRQRRRTPRVFRVAVNGASRVRVTAEVRRRLGEPTTLPNLTADPLTDETAVRVALATHIRAYHGPGTQVDGRTVAEALARAAAGGDVFRDVPSLWDAVERWARFGLAHAPDTLAGLGDLLRHERVGLDWGLLAVDVAETMEGPVGAAQVVHGWVGGYYECLGVPRTEALSVLLAVLDGRN